MPLKILTALAMVNRFPRVARFRSLMPLPRFHGTDTLCDGFIRLFFVWFTIIMLNISQSFFFMTWIIGWEILCVRTTGYCACMQITNITWYMYFFVFLHVFWSMTCIWLVSGTKMNKVIWLQSIYSMALLPFHVLKNSLSLCMACVFQLKECY